MRLFEAGARGDGAETVHDRVWTVPNAVTALRLAGLPLFVWLVLGPAWLAAAFWTLAVVASSDWVDGYLARRLDQVSRLGKILDPLVDRAVLATAGLTLLVAGVVPAWLVAAVVARDVLLLGGALLLFGRIPPIPVTRTGKFATANLLAAFPSFLLAAIEWFGQAAFAWLAVLLSAVGLGAYLVATGQYVRAGLRLARDRRRAA